MAVQVLDPLEVVDGADRVDVVLGRAAVLGHVQGAVLGQLRVERAQQVIEPVGLDQPAHRGLRQLLWLAQDHARAAADRGLVRAEASAVVESDVLRRVVVDAEEVHRS